MKRLLQALGIIAVLVSLASADRGRVKLVNQTLVADNGYLLRGCHAHLHDFSYNAFKNLKWWTDLRDKAKLNTVRVMAFYGEWPNSTETMDATKIKARLDAAVNNAAQAGMYVIIDNHSTCCVKHDRPTIETFWNIVAPRYKDRTHVIYEIQNEPGAASAILQRDMLNLIRGHAPLTHVICWSFSRLDDNRVSAAENATGISYANASIGFHPYGYSGQASHTALTFIQRLKNVGPVIMTEITDCCGTANAAAVIDKMEELKISWMWLAGGVGTYGTGFDPNTFTVKWPADPGCVGTGVTFRESRLPVAPVTIRTGPTVYSIDGRQINAADIPTGVYIIRGNSSGVPAIKKVLIK